MQQKIIETKNCTNCSAQFEVTDQDLAFYDKISPVLGGKKYTIPSPTYCPDCRQQRRLTFRNERKLYRRKCASSGQDIISIYSSEKPYIVYDQKVWRSDAYDPLAYGRNFDFSKSFFEQYKELMHEVPLPAIGNTKSENCDYTNYSAENKDCYMSIGCLQCENVYHSYRVFHSTNIVDCYDMQKSAWCYECLESKNLFQCSYCQDCHDCSNCFGCVDIKNKEYCIFNKQYTKDKYFEKMKTLHFQEGKMFLQNNAVKNIVINCENCTGDRLMNCKNCIDGYVLKDSEDCTRFRIGENNVSCYDANFGDNCQLQYDSSNLETNYKCARGNLVWYTSDSYYLMISFNSKNCFGCIGLKGQEYCILNKQYTKEAYEELVPKIIAHMQETQERGEYFPITLSPFAYNETVAGERYPLAKEKIVSLGYKWKDDEDKNYQGPVYTPLSISAYADETNQQGLLNGILQCEETGRPYRIVKQELLFYLKMGISIPTKHPDVRHHERMKGRNPRKLRDRQCDKCGVEIQTTYAPERLEKIYCEKCYEKEIYS